MPCSPPSRPLVRRATVTWRVKQEWTVRAEAEGRLLQGSRRRGKAGCSRAGAEGRVLPEEGVGQGAPGFQEKGEGGVLQVSRRRGRAECSRFPGGGGGRGAPGFQEKGEGGVLQVSRRRGRAWCSRVSLSPCSHLSLIGRHPGHWRSPGHRRSHQHILANSCRV